jgi:formamidopyrimidine-DNA glycosylase
MPELPEVETVRRGLEPVMVGAKFKKVELRRSNLRFPFPPNFSQALEGKRIETLTRRAKYICIHLDNATVLIIHLGMSGRVLISGNTVGEFHQELNKHPQHDHVVFDLDNGHRITYNDIRRFGFMDLVQSKDIETCKHFKGMGIEPLSNAFNADVLAKLFTGKSTPLKTALLDQRLVCGLGNIYVCEALHRAGLSPFAAAGSLLNNKAKIEALALEIKLVLQEALQAGGSSLRDYTQADGSLGYFQHGFRVYDREGTKCSKNSCNGTIKRVAQSGRSTFYCEECQPV